MEYKKPALSIEQQADQLLNRGLIADRQELIKVLQHVSYYRLSGYLFPFRAYPEDHFHQGTEFKNIWRRYTFDRQLRLLVLDGIERVEIALRADITNRLAQEGGPFAYIEHSTFPRLVAYEHEKLTNDLKNEYAKSKETFVRHFQGKYGDVHDMLPIWMVTELISFGALFTMYRGLQSSICKSIAKKYKLNEKILISWLGSLNAVRNICAHHARLWNRELGYKPMIPLKDNDWHHPVSISENRVFVILCIIRYMMNFTAPGSGWGKRLVKLLKDYNEIPIKEMGFPDRWEDIPFWRSEQL